MQVLHNCQKLELINKYIYLSINFILYGIAEISRYTTAGRKVYYVVHKKNEYLLKKKQKCVCFYPLYYTKVGRKQSNFNTARMSL